MKLTKHRQEILTILKTSKAALSAAEVHTFLPHINLVTIYRNLEGFALAGTIKKLYLDSSEALFEFQEQPHHHAVCNTCSKVVHFEVPDATLKKLLQVPNFSISGVELVVHGACTHAHSTPLQK